MNIHAFLCLHMSTKRGLFTPFLYSRASLQKLYALTQFCCIGIVITAIASLSLSEILLMYKHFHAYMHIHMYAFVGIFYLCMRIYKKKNNDIFTPKKRSHFMNANKAIFTCLKIYITTSIITYVFIYKC